MMTWSLKLLLFFIKIVFFIFFLQYDAVNLIYVRNQIDEALASHR